MNALNGLVARLVLLLSVAAFAAVAIYAVNVYSEMPHEYIHMESTTIKREIEVTCPAVSNKNSGQGAIFVAVVSLLCGAVVGGVGMNFLVVAGVRRNTESE